MFVRSWSIRCSFFSFFSRSRIQPAALLRQIIEQNARDFLSSFSHAHSSMLSASGHNCFQLIYLHPFPLPYYGLLMPLSSILVPLSSILIDFLSNFRSTLWPFSQLLSAYLINILSVVHLFCLPYFEVFPVLTFSFIHFIAVQIIRRFLSPPN